MEQSILNSVKLSVGISIDDPSFDTEIINAVNAEFSILNDIGIGPSIGFVIEDEVSEWSDYLDVEGDEEKKVWLSKVKMAVNLRTRLLFDPPKEPVLLNSIQGQLAEQEWRLNTNREAIAWIDPNPPVVVDAGESE